MGHRLQIPTGKRLHIDAIWTPGNISTAAWYDAADSGTITEDGGLVSQWGDKSGNARDISQPAGGYQPAYNLTDAVAFDGTDDWLGNSAPFMYDNGECSAFIVSTPTRVASNDIFLGEGSLSDSRPSYATARWLNSEMGSSIRQDNGAIQIDDEHGILPVVSTRALFEWKDTGSACSARQNGGTESTPIAYTRTGSVTTDTFTLCAIRSGFATVRYIQGDIHEVVICNNLSNEDREKMEGYLAWKWGLVGNLPIGHPYKTEAPHV